MRIVEMLFSTSLIALVGTGQVPALSPRKLLLVNTKRQSTVCELAFRSTILAVKMNRKRLIVALEQHLYIYDISNMKLVHTIDTAANKNAIIALSPSSERCFLAYPASSPSFKVASSVPALSGDLVLFDAASMQNLNVIQAHKSPVSCIAFSQDGALLASSSEKGTVIRVFITSDGTKAFQFRRGSLSARIYSLAFNPLASLLCLTSDTETVHVFKLTRPSHTVSRTSSSLTEFIPSLISSHITMPGVLSEMWDPERHFAHMRIPMSGSHVKSIAMFSPSGSQVMVLTSEGNFYTYALNSESGGECALSRQYSVLNVAEGESKDSLVYLSGSPPQNSSSL